MIRSSFWFRIFPLLLLAVLVWPLLIDRQGSAVVQAGVLEQLPASTDALTHVLSYQGRLADPATGAPKADGSYSMTFRIYDAAAAGTTLWTEIKDIPVSKGLFSTLLGDTTALPTTLFDGNDRWLGVKVLSDAETAPRMRMAFVPYASWALNAGALEGQNAAFYRNASNINAGTLADAQIPAAITRDDEVITIVKGADGSGSGVDADLLDGQNSTAFAASTHNHDGAYVNQTGPDSMTGSSDTSAIFSVTQSGSQDGVFATTASTEAGEGAIHGRAGTAGPAINSVAAVVGDSNDGRGVVGTSTNSDGMLGYSTNGNGVNGQSSNGYGVYALSVSNHALYAAGSAQVTGNLTVGGVINNPMAPIALAFINADGSKSVGSANVSSVWSGSRYDITISGYSYFWTSFITVVTPVCANYRANTSSVSGKLLVEMYNSSGTAAQCAFQFVTYKP